MAEFGLFDREPVDGFGTDARYWIALYSELLASLRLMLAEDVLEPERSLLLGRRASLEARLAFWRHELYVARRP